MSTRETTERTETERDSRNRFIGFLKRLEREQDRGRLARLRRSVGKAGQVDVKTQADALRIIADYLPDDEYRHGEPAWERRCFELVAGLFALHPDPGGTGDFGHTFAHPDLGKKNESSQKRFVALLASDAEELAYRLRQCVALAKSKGVRIDWRKLLEDLRDWNAPDRRVQYRWARSFWGGNSEKREDGDVPVEQANEKEGE